MGWHEAAPGRPKFLFKLKLTTLVRSALHRIKESDWQGPAILGACQMAEGRIQLTGWKTARRVVFARTLQGVVPAAGRAEFGDQHKHEFAVYATNLPDEVNGWQIQELYRQRADTEHVFDELKNQWGFSGFCAKSKATTELAARPGNDCCSSFTTCGRCSCASSCRKNILRPNAVGAGSCSSPPGSCNWAGRRNYKSL